jgi:hypothetical protein
VSSASWAALQAEILMAKAEVDRARRDAQASGGQPARSAAHL